MVISKFLHGFPTDDGLLPPRMEIASMHIAQVHEDDIGHQLAHQYAIPLYESIRETLKLGWEDLAVAAVLLFGEPGAYPKTVLGQEMTPRRHMFEQITAVLINAKRPIPIYNDKHLSYRWDHATFMYETAVERKIPFWAASALPVIWRNPNFEHALGEPIDQALVIGLSHFSGATMVGGGLPIIHDDEVIGGIGVGGGTVDEDIACSQAGLDVLKN